MNSEYSLAKKLFFASRTLQWFIVIVAIIAIINDIESALAVTLVAFLSPIAIFVCEAIGRHYYEKGERIRRLMILQDGLGREPSEVDLLEILARQTRPSKSEPQPIGEGYYASVAASGLPRLLYRVYESAFWTGELASMAAMIHFAIALTGVIISSVIAFCVLHPSVASSTIDFSRLFSTLLVFFVAGIEMNSARSFYQLYKTASAVLTQASRLHAQTSLDPMDMHVLMSNYDSALSSSYPIPSYIYSMMQKKLQASWDAIPKWS